MQGSADVRVQSVECRKVKTVECSMYGNETVEYRMQESKYCRVYIVGE